MVTSALSGVAIKTGVAVLAAVKTAQEKADSSKYVLIDVRPRGRFEEGRIPGAVSVPLYQKASSLLG